MSVELCTRGGIRYKLPDMPLARRLGTVTPSPQPQNAHMFARHSARRTGLVLLVASSLACRGERTPEPRPQAPPLTTPTQETAEEANPAVHWDSAAGDALVLALGATGDSALIVRPQYVDSVFDGWTPDDVRPLARSRWDLFGRSGSFGSGQLTPDLKASQSEECLTWPPGMMSTLKAGWRAGLEAGRATAIPLDSVEALSQTDSSAFVIQVTKLAASTHGPSDSLFASIPFVVRNAYRFRTGDIEAIIASVQRSIHSEANPREEHLFLIAERPVGSSGEYHIAYATRSAGSERGVAITDVLTTVTLSANRRLALIASHEYDDGGEIWWIERIAPGRWRATWRSAAVGC